MSGCFTVFDTKEGQEIVIVDRTTDEGPTMSAYLVSTNGTFEVKWVVRHRLLCRDSWYYVSNDEQKIVIRDYCLDGMIDVEVITFSGEFSETHLAAEDKYLIPSLIGSGALLAPALPTKGKNLKLLENVLTPHVPTITFKDDDHFLNSLEVIGICAVKWGWLIITYDMCARLVSPNCERVLGSTDITLQDYLKPPQYGGTIAIPRHLVCTPMECNLVTISKYSATDGKLTDTVFCIEYDETDGLQMVDILKKHGTNLEDVDTRYMTGPFVVNIRNDSVRIELRNIILTTEDGHYVSEFVEHWVSSVIVCNGGKTIAYVTSDGLTVKDNANYGDIVSASV